MSSNQKNLSQRHQARVYALQALYQWELLSVLSVRELLQQFEEDPEFQNIDKAYWQTLVAESIANMTELDQTIEPYLTRPLMAVSPVELSILRLAFCELRFCIATPYRVIINEAIELAKTFGAADSHRFVNAILDKAAKALRPD